MAIEDGLYTDVYSIVFSLGFDLYDLLYGSTGQNFLTRDFHCYSRSL